MIRKTWFKIGVVALGVLALLAVSIAFQMDLPDPTGPYAVGRTSRLWVDSTRPETLTSNPDDPRSVPVIIWYPAEAGSGENAPYFPGLAALAEGLRASGEVSPVEVFGLRFIRSSERLDAQVAEEGAPYPVIIFSPGGATNMEFNVGLAGELASHGYVVVGINHPFDVAAAPLHDGSVAVFVEGPFEMEAREDWAANRVDVRTADMLFVLRQLANLNSSADSPLAGRLDLERTAAAGHSLGGIAAAGACRAEPAFLSCLNLDGIQRGGPFSTDQNPAPTNQPFMFITKEPEIPPLTVVVFEAVASGSFVVTIHDANHDSFTDGPLLLPSLLPLPNKADRFLSLTRTYTLAFFEQTLRQQASALLAETTHSDQVSVEVFSPQTE